MESLDPLSVGYFKTLHNPSTDWCYKAEPDPGLNGRALDWPRGKTLGGSSSINGLVYIRGQREDYDQWAQLCNRGWSYDDVLPLFKRSERHEDGESDYHGASGNLAVSNMRAKSDVAEAFIDAAVEMGVPRTNDVNGAVQEGASYFQQTARNGLRCSSAKVFLKPVRSRSNLQIVTPAFTKEDGTPKFPGGYPDYMVNHERKPGVGPLAGWRGENGDIFGRGAPNPEQLDRYIENGAFYAHHLSSTLSILR